MLCLKLLLLSTQLVEPAASGMLFMNRGIVRDKSQIGKWKQCSHFPLPLTVLQNLFHHVYNEENVSFKVLHSAGEDSWKIYFDGYAQDIVNEFSLRYGVEPIYQAMTCVYVTKLFYAQ